MTDEIRRRIDELDRAIEARTPLDIQYEDIEEQVSNRRVRPLGLWFWGKVWTLVAWCELREDFRVFRIDRLRSLAADDTPFRPERGQHLTDFFRQMRAREA